MPDIIKAYLQSPRTWIYVGQVAVLLLKGNSFGLTDEWILTGVSLVSSIFTASVSYRPPRSWDGPKDAA